MDESVNNTSQVIIILLSLFLLGLILLLIFLYKKLNRETNGEYTIWRIMFKEGGVRDRVRSAILTLETHLGIRLWPRGNTDEDGEEMQEVEVLQAQAEVRGSGISNSEGDSQEEEEEEEEEDNVEQCGKTRREEDNTSNEKSSLEDSEAGEQIVPTDQSEAKEETEEKREEGEGEACGGAGLSIDLKQFSGSAIWSGEEGNGGMSRDVTAL